MDLKDLDHPYYCAHGNFFKSGWYEVIDSWEDFMEFAKDWDMDMSFVFRWDWKVSGDYHTLDLHWVQQRKGIVGSHTIRVKPTDEPAVRAWLLPRWEHMQRMWAPLSTPEE